ncbi:hypothetical protein [Frateuria soli]|uniref:hypothetical protein n=1 Tax=Frateuria soli TaxID=1542730 RepID=UPI001E4E5CD0|nr:hypothetical protein [Frateuria soli]UGB38002.1 hypothetical protein LQ771_14495 [Frateuria soli]
MESAELEAVVTQANEALAAIQEAHGRSNVPEARIRFPRGFILPAATYQSGLPRLGTKVQRSNASYALQAIDVLRWVCVRTDLSGVALSMIIKEAICVIGAICEWLTKEATRGDGARRSYTRRTQKLVDRGAITKELKAEVDWIWDVRCNEHLHEVQSLELSMYSRRDYNRALDAFKALKSALIEVYGKAGA